MECNCWECDDRRDLRAGLYASKLSGRAREHSKPSQDGLDREYTFQLPGKNGEYRLFFLTVNVSGNGSGTGARLFDTNCEVTEQ